MKKLVLILFAGLAISCNETGKPDADRDTTLKVTGEGDTVRRVTDTDTINRGNGDTTIRKKIDTDTLGKKDDQ
jgi:hypothetical protein